MFGLVRIQAVWAFQGIDFLEDDDVSNSFFVAWINHSLKTRGLSGFRLVHLLLTLFLFLVFGDLLKDIVEEEDAFLAFQKFAEAGKLVVKVILLLLLSNLLIQRVCKTQVLAFSAIMCTILPTYRETWQMRQGLPPIEVGLLLSDFVEDPFQIVSWIKKGLFEAY